MDALNNVKASAVFLTDLDENDDVGGSWAWMIRRYMIMDALFAASDAVREPIPINGNAVAHHNRAITQSQLIRQVLTSTEGET